MAEYIEREALQKRLEMHQATNPATIGKKQFQEGYYLGLSEAEIMVAQAQKAEVLTIANERRLISVCGECANYNWKRHRCTVCSCKESDPRNPFYDDCPLPKGIEIVHCKDCKQWMYECDDIGLCVTDVPDIEGVQRCADDFCSYGERKNENQ